MAVLKNRAKMSTSTTGTGTITLDSAEDGYQSFADAGVVNADVVRYVIEDGSNFEIGTGTYTATGTTLTRTVSESSNSDAAINLSGSATVFIGATAEDILSDVVDDTTPQLGGNLDVQAREITTSTTNGNVKLTPNGTGVVEVKGAGGNDGTLQLNCSANSHGVKIKSPPHSAAASYTLTLPDDDGAASEFLQTDGSGNLSWAAGGGADLYIANPVSATDPTAGGDNAVGIGDGADATGNDSIAIGTDTIAGLESVAIGYNAASGTTTGSRNTSIGRSAAIYLTTGSNNTAVGRSALQGSNLDKVTGSDNTAVGNGAGSKNAGGNNNTYLGTNAGNAITSGSSNTFIGYNADGAATTSQQTALGYQAETAGTGATAINNSYASGTDSFAAAIATNSSSYGASGSNSIAGGDYNKATATDSLCWGGDSNVAQSGAKSAVVGGWQNNCSGAYSFISGGRGNKITSGSYSRAGGLQANVNGTGIDTWSSGRFSSDGDAQTSKRVLIANTTDATATVLGTQNINSLAANQVTLPNNSAFFFSGTCIAREQAADGTDVGAWEFKGAIRREANAGTTTLIKSTIDDFNVPTGWALALSADTTNGCLKIQATGVAATDIRWVATVQTSEVIYA